MTDYDEYIRHVIGLGMDEIAWRLRRAAQEEREREVARKVERGRWQTMTRRQRRRQMLVGRRVAAELRRQMPQD